MRENKNSFQKFKVFDNDPMNKLCDQVISLVEELTNETPAVCGSVAKLFGEQLQEDYTPKDVDFVVSRWAFRQLLWKIPTEITGVKMIEQNPNRIILFTDYRYCIEIWVHNAVSEKRELKKYQNEILYTDYGKEN